MYITCHSYIGADWESDAIKNAAAVYAVDGNIVTCIDEYGEKLRYKIHVSKKGKVTKIESLDKIYDKQTMFDAVEHRQEEIYRGP